MIVITSKVTCCGCWACEYFVKAFVWYSDERILRFRYPEVDVEVCYRCGLCEASMSHSS